MSEAPVTVQPLSQRMFAALADGRFHSGSELALAQRVTRSAVWKAMRQLRAMGAPLQAVTHRGYRLAPPLPPLHAAQIFALLGESAAGVKVELQWSLQSTNLTLLARPAPAAGEVVVLLAEHQAAGRGRRGREWLAPLGGALCLSFSTTFAELPPEVSALSLAIGVCVLRALRGLDLQQVALKWPNDIVTRRGKLGGILIELRAESGGPAQVVVGIGLNVQLGAAALAQVQATGTAATDLRSSGADVSSRNAIAAALITECVRGLREFSRLGFAPFKDEWSAADALRDQPVIVSGGALPTAEVSLARASGVSGIARGIDARGALLLDTADGQQAIVAGEVSVRANT